MVVVERRCRAEGWMGGMWVGRSFIFFCSFFFLVLDEDDGLLEGRDR